MSNEPETRVEWRVFLAWHDDREEAWLRDMARQGWHLRRPSLFRYVFDRGAPADVVYKLDYNVLLRGRREEYEALFRAAGWEHVGEIANWHYFRTLAGEGADPDIFTDTDSRVAKYRRVIWVLLLLLPSQFFLISRLAEHTWSIPATPLGAVTAAGALFYALILGFWLYGLVRLGLHIARLRRKGRGSAAGAPLR